MTNACDEIFVSDFRGGVTCIKPDGQQTFWGGAHPEIGLLQTNGFCILRDGSFLIAHLGLEQGGVYQITRSNEIKPWLTSIEGKPMPPTNFVYLDHQGRIWITVSTRTIPRADAYRKDCCDGYIVLVDSDGARIVADGLGYTNEVWITPEGTELFVNATFSRQLIRYQIINNELVKPEVVTQFGAGTFPDGLTRDLENNLWVTSIISNRVIRVSPSGHCEIVIEDSNKNYLESVERAYNNHSLGRSHLDNNPSKLLRNISSLAFANGRILMGCLLGEQIYQICTNIKGVAPAHWKFPNV